MQDSENKVEITLLIKLMAIAVKNNKDYKAFDLAKMMPNKQSLELASRYFIFQMYLVGSPLLFKCSKPVIISAYISVLVYTVLCIVYSVYTV